MRPSSRNRRVTWNARLTKLTQTLPEQGITHKSREQVVIEMVCWMCGQRLGGDMSADDLASDIIERLWASGGFAWETNEIKAYVNTAVRRRASEIFKRKTVSEWVVGENGDDLSLFDVRRFVTPPHQETHVEAILAMALVRALPEQQMRALLILGGGGNPIEVASELGLEPWAAIRLIKEARANIYRVDRVEDMRPSPFEEQ
jgi:DNA-directed RNA polymerase specialized sigma24 family protein